MSRKKRTYDDQRLRLVVSMVLRTAREVNGLTQQEVADKAGLTRTSVVNIESGTQGTPLHLFMAICKAVGVKPYRAFQQVEQLMNLQ